MKESSNNANPAHFFTTAYKTLSAAKGLRVSGNPHWPPTQPIVCEVAVTVVLRLVVTVTHFYSCACT